MLGLAALDLLMTRGAVISGRHVAGHQTFPKSVILVAYVTPRDKNYVWTERLGFYSSRTLFWLSSALEGTSPLQHLYLLWTREPAPSHLQENVGLITMLAAKQVLRDTWLK